MAYNRNVFTKGVEEYKDIDLSFRQNPLTGDINKKIDVHAINQSLKVLLLSKIGERPFNPLLNGGLNDLLFEPFDQITADVIRTQISYTINNYEPRVSLRKIDIVDNIDENSLEVSIYYNIENTSQTQQLNMIIDRIR